MVLPEPLNLESPDFAWWWWCSLNHWTCCQQTLHGDTPPLIRSLMPSLSSGTVTVHTIKIWMFLPGLSELSRWTRPSAKKHIKWKTGSVTLRLKISPGTQRGVRGGGLRGGILPRKATNLVLTGLLVFVGNPNIYNIGVQGAFIPSLRVHLWHDLCVETVCWFVENLCWPSVSLCKVWLIVSSLCPSTKNQQYVFDLRIVLVALQWLLALWEKMINMQQILCWLLLLQACALIAQASKKKKKKKRLCCTSCCKGVAEICCASCCKKMYSAGGCKGLLC